MITIKLVDARRGLHAKCVELFSNEKIAESIYRYLCDGIEECKYAEPERKKGKWITDKYGNVLCSECGWCAPQIMIGCIANRYFDYDKSNFCWHCGSDNREESNYG